MHQQIRSWAKKFFVKEGSRAELLAWSEELLAEIGKQLAEWREAETPPLAVFTF